jgi:hypothetical protein
MKPLKAEDLEDSFLLAEYYSDSGAVLSLFVAIEHSNSPAGAYGVVLDRPGESSEVMCDDRSIDLALLFYNRELEKL